MTNPPTTIFKIGLFFTNRMISLPKRKMRFWKYIVAGKNSNTIANELHIRLHTVNTHRKNMLIKSKLQVTIDLVTKVINEVLIRRAKNT